jgi:hypothetical protein
LSVAELLRISSSLCYSCVLTTAVLFVVGLAFWSTSTSGRSLSVCSVHSRDTDHSGLGCLVVVVWPCWLGLTVVDILAVFAF